MDSDHEDRDEGDYFYVAAKNKYGDVSERMATNETVKRAFA